MDDVCTLHNNDIDKMDTFGKSDAYLQFFRIREDSM
jgi:hypothetical protein